MRKDITKKEIRNELDDRYLRASKRQEKYYMEIAINKRLKNIRLKTLLYMYYLLTDEETTTREKLLILQNDMEEK